VDDRCIDSSSISTDCDFSGDSAHKLSDLLELSMLPAWTKSPSEGPNAIP
jgi:hypothetical protein